MWYDYPGSAAQAVLQTDAAANLKGDLPSLNGDYYLDVNGGADLGGKSFEIITGAMNAGDTRTTNLGSSFPIQFNLKWTDSQGNLQMMSFFPAIVSEIQGGIAANPTTIPTLNQWGVMAFVLLTGLAAFGIMRRRGRG